jgi:hypothetical protein
METLQQQQPSSQPLIAQSESQLVDSPDGSAQVISSCRLRDQVIQQFLDGAGI